MCPQKRTLAPHGAPTKIGPDGLKDQREVAFAAMWLHTRTLLHDEPYGKVHWLELCTGRGHLSLPPKIPSALLAPPLRDLQPLWTHCEGVPSCVKMDPFGNDALALCKRADHSTGPYQRGFLPLRPPQCSPKEILAH